MSQCFWGKVPEFLLSSRMFLLKKYADLEVVSCEVVGFPIPEKWQSVQKKGQAETCPYPQKEAK